MKFILPVRMYPNGRIITAKVEPVYDPSFHQGLEIQELKEELQKAQLNALYWETKAAKYSSAW